MTKLLCDIGAAYAANHDANARNIKAQNVQCDEIWSFCYTKAKNVNNAVAAHLALNTPLAKQLERWIK